MARVTVEDCVLQIPNRFELVMLSAHRARALSSGAEIKVERDRDKNPVVALREIAEEKLELGGLSESLIKSLQKRIEPDQLEEEVVDLMVSEQQNWLGAPDEDETDDEDDIVDADLDEEGRLEPSGNQDFGGQGSFEDAAVED